MDYLQSIQTMLGEPVFRYVFVGLLWALVLTLVFLIVFTVWQFIVKASRAKHGKTPGQVETHAGAALVLIVVIAAILIGGIWLLRNS